MKRSPAVARQFFKQPDPSFAGALIYGPDLVLVSHHRKCLVESLLGESVGDDLAVSTLDPTEAGRDAGAISIVLTERGFFSGRRVVVLESANQRHLRGIERALADSDPEDAFLVVTAGELRRNSKLLEYFQSAENAVALPSEAEFWSPAEIRRHFVERGVPPPDANASDLLVTLSEDMEWGPFNMLIEKLILYMHERSGETTTEDIDNCAPAADFGDLDGFVDAVCGGSMSSIAEQGHALASKGGNPVARVNAVLRHLHTVHGVVVRSRSRADVESVARFRPMHPARRYAVTAHARGWSRARLEEALRELHATDLGIRGGTAAPIEAFAERSLMRVAGRAPRPSARSGVRRGSRP